MRTIVVYESMFGNTRDIAHAIAEGLAEWSNVSITDVDSADAALVTSADLVVAGGPTHGFSMSREQTRQDALTRGATSGSRRGLRDWLESVDLSAPIPLATFDTHASQRWIPGSASHAAAKAARRRGFLPVARKSFFVRDVSGPLVSGELERARYWGRGLSARLRS